MLKPAHIPQQVWDGLNEVGQHYLTQETQARLVEVRITPERKE